MKKIVIAAALAAASLGALAQVTVSGKVSEWVSSTKIGSTTTNSMVAEPTSNIGFSANEKLAGGVAARVVVETSISGNTIGGTGTQLGDRQSTVGIASKFGSVDLGRNVHSEFLAITNNDVFGTLYGSIAGDVHNLRGLRMSNAVFISATPTPGVTATLDRSQNGTGTEATAYSLSGGVRGVKGTVAYYESGIEKSTVIGLNTKLANTTLMYSHSDNKGLVASKGDLFGVSQAFGPFAVKASYGKTDQKTKAYALGLDYSLSKRTDVGIAYRNADFRGSASDVDQVGVGLTHRF